MARRQVTPEEALDPRNRPSVEQLLVAIHEVNPTNRQLTPAETSRRYALKSRLQSLLVRKFPPALAVEAEDAGGVLIRHVRGDRDFCHAVVAQLDDDACSWIRLQLDTPAEPVRPMEAPVEHDQGRDDPLADARAALDAWDYDLARTLLDQARVAGNRAALPMLVELLVDSLGDDTAALALDLPDADAPVRARLAVAAARSGAPGRALRLLGGVTPPQAAEARLLLASAALTAGNLEGADRFLALPGKATPNSLDCWQSPSGSRPSGRSESRPSRPSSAPRDFRTSHVESSRSTLKNALAREVIKHDGDQRRKQHRETLLADAKTAENAGDLVMAKERYQHAADAGADVRADLERLTRIASDKRVSDAVVQVRTAPGRNVRDGLAAWLGLEPTLRTQAQAEPTRWLSEFPDAPDHAPTSSPKLRSPLRGSRPCCRQAKSSRPTRPPNHTSTASAASQAVKD